MLVRQKDGNMYMMILNDKLSLTYRNVDHITRKCAQGVGAICQYVQSIFLEKQGPLLLLSEVPLSAIVP